MTDVAPTPASTDRSTVQAPGHPVRSFSLVLVGIGLVLLALQASGLVLPRVTNPQGLGTGVHVTGGRASWAAVIENEGLLSVRIESVSWPVAGPAETEVEVQPRGVTIPGAPPSAAPVPTIRPFTLEPGERRVVIASGRSTCTGSLRTGALTVRARSLLGVTRDVVVRPADHSGVTCG